MKQNVALQKLSDEALVQRIAQTRDTGFFEELYNRYAKVVYNKCFRFVSDSAEAEDLTQDIFLKLYISAGKFNGRSKFSTWLFSFTYNFCVNYINRNNKLDVTTDSTLIEQQQNTIIEIDDESILQLKYDKLEKALAIISPDEKLILLLKYQDEASIRELQELLNLGESAVKMRLSRAKSNLIEIYNGLEHEA